MILLVVLSLVGVMVVRDSMQESRTASDFKDAIVAMSYAKTGIEYGRARILNVSAPFGTFTPTGNLDVEVSIVKIGEDSLSSSIMVQYFRVTSTGRYLDQEASFPDNILSQRTITSIERLAMEL